MSGQKTFTAIPGVFAQGVHSGVKKADLDLGLLYVPDAYACAGVFTQNKFAASSVTYTKKCLKRHTLKAVVVNAGNANAGTGEQGVQNTRAMASQVAKGLGLSANEVGVASTGIIGVQLDMDKISSGIDAALSSPEVQDGDAFYRSILTTDLTLKPVYVEGEINGKKVIIAGATKGSGMIAPNMATTLSFLATNVRIRQASLQTVFNEAIDDTFNMTSVDTDTSTNDMALLFSTGEPGMTIQGAELDDFIVLLKQACEVLCKAIAMDGEGATKLITACAKGAASKKDARLIAKQIVDSPLVKTAVHGADPNWGRVLAAASKNPDVKINPDKVTVTFGDVVVFDMGQPVEFDRERLVTLLKGKDIVITVDLHLRTAEAVAWGCDLTKGYIDINTQYS